MSLKETRRESRVKWSQTDQCYIVKAKWSQPDYDTISNEIRAQHDEIAYLKAQTEVLARDTISSEGLMESAERRLESAERRLEFAEGALDVLVPHEALTLASQLLLIKLGEKPKHGKPRYCTDAYENRDGHGKPFVKMLAAEFPMENISELVQELDSFLEAGNSYAHTLPVEESIRHSKRKAESMLNDYDGCTGGGTPP